MLALLQSAAEVAAKHKADLDDRILHYALFAGGAFAVSFFKIGFDYIAKRTWDKIDEEAKDIKEFRAWKKAGKPKAS
jgi:hypothetical protein